MSFDDNQKLTGRNATDSKQPTSSQNPKATPNHAHQTPAPRPVIHYKQQVGSIPEENPDNNFIKQGKTLAHTINAPFTTIPGIPAATPILRRIDKATGQDLGFTYKASVSSEENAQGSKDLIYKIDYVGFGIMSNKFNVQVAPLAAKIEAGKEVYKGFGCNLSTLASPIGLIHERVGAKATVTDCNSTSESISVAGEISYQKSSSFKPISTATGGYFPGYDATIRIPAKAVHLYQLATDNFASWRGTDFATWKERNLPSLEESGYALPRIISSIANPVLMMGEATSNAVELTINLTKSAQPTIKSALSTTESMLKSAKELYVNGINVITNQLNTQPASPAIAQPAATSNATGNVPTGTNQHSKPYVPAYSIAVKPGENLWDIAVREKGDPNQYKVIAEKNHIKDPDSIFPTKEKKLVIPGYQKSNEEKAIYTVRTEDTLDMIGKKTGHTAAEIFALNKHILKNNPDKIYPGQELLIPDDHAALMNNPVVLARIREIAAKQQTSELIR